MTEIKDPVTGATQTIPDSASQPVTGKTEIEEALKDTTDAVKKAVEEELPKVEEVVSTDKTHFVHGLRVLMSEEESKAFAALHDELEAARSGRLLSDIPARLDDEYHKVLAKIDEFVAKLRRI